MSLLPILSPCFGTTGNIFVTHIGPLYMDSAITWCDQQLLLPTTCTDTWPVFILFQMIRRIGKSFVHRQSSTWWGVCLPTTCYYQYISKRNDIEVYQWFLCPELGTTYRIKNYWVHHFLAGFFLTEHWLRYTLWMKELILENAHTLLCPPGVV